MMTILTIAILLVVLYAGITIWGLKGLPDSISAMVYVLPRQGQWLWIVWMWVVSLCVCIPMIGALPDAWKILGFVTLGCLMLCGAMPISSSTTNKKWHDALGIAGGILSQVCVAVISPWWLAAWVLFAAVYGYDLLPSQNGRIYPSRWYDGKGVFVAEMICLLTSAGALIEYYV